MRPILIRGGRILDPSRGTDEVADLYLADGKVQASGRDLGRPDDALVLEAAGKVVCPGLIDLHVHLREPGQEDLETVATGAMAAANAGRSAQPPWTARSSPALPSSSARFPNSLA